jgi:hypothetical protein
MPDFVKEFIDKAWDHWLYLMGILLMVEPLLDYYWEGYKKWADRFTNRRARTRFAIAVSFLAILWVCLLTFRDQYEETKSKTAQLAAATIKVEAGRVEIEGQNGDGGLKKRVSDLEAQLREKQRELLQAESEKPRETVRYLPSPPVTVSLQPIQRHLSEAQHKTLIVEMIPYKDQLRGLLVISEGGESARYAMDFIKAFKEAGIAAVYGPFPGTSDRDTDRGVLVGFTDPDHQSPLGQKFVVAMRNSGIDVNITRSGGTGSSLDFDVFICSQ